MEVVWREFVSASGSKNREFASKWVENREYKAHQAFDALDISNYFNGFISPLSTFLFFDITGTLIDGTGSVYQ